jgi:uncharacterized membrane protein YeaQ/YmgE (transglycosylase-associated protein family)
MAIISAIIVGLIVGTSPGAFMLQKICWVITILLALVGSLVPFK